ncbi:UNVERIFIED_CONTAM: Calcium uptake protein, mitochondrial [Sesamum radiatum]|uniref:Calcium uptake protein, mitochondrial n=1 Tax=Sesamum radiatum TaxID=300843 RepID=A0AAW2KYZ2_SESRA
MPSSSALPLLLLRRSSSSPSILQPFHFRHLSTASPPPSPHIHNSSYDNAKSNLLRWISAGLVTTSTFALSLYSFSSSSSSLNSQYVSFADWSTPTTSAALSPSSLHNQNAEPNFLFGEAYRRKVFFNYEKRIRMRSPPEKVFEYFASVRGNDGEVFMTPADLMRALVPVFPPSESHLVRWISQRGKESWRIALFTITVFYAL